MRRHETADPATASPLVRLWRYSGGHRRTVFAAITASVVNKLADVMPELLIGAAVDVVVRGNDSIVARAFGVEDRFDQLLVLAAINVVVWIVESLTDYAAQILWRNLAQTIEHEARMDAYRHVQRLELGWFEDQSTGGLLAVLNDDVNQLERFLDIGANELIRTLVNVLFVGVVFFVAEPILGVVAFAPIPVIVWASVRYQRRLEPRYTDVRQAAGDLGALLANNVSGIVTIRSFTAEERESERVAAASTAYREANRSAIKLSSAFIPLIRMAILAAFTRHADRRRAGGARRHARRRHVLGPRVHDPAAAVAAHPAGRDLRPLPAGHGVDAAHPRPAGGRPDHRRRSRRAARAARGCGRASRTCGSATEPGGRSSTGSPSPCRPARPTPSSGRRAPASRPS